ncbi:CC_3452 family protein [Sphingomonas flavalba]|uniref:CC_3452 family protein n=1 Tax=Sphingomonas flavalba TaxID=2559804 RepID=UPI0039E10242
MLRSLSLAGALAASSLFVSAPAAAQPGAFYNAIPATAPAAGRTVIRDQIWSCDDNSCVSARGDSRPAVVCAVAARQLGRLTAFTVNGEAFDAAALDKCNARAK